MSGLDIDGREIRKGAAGALLDWAGTASAEITDVVDRISDEGGTPLAVAVREHGQTRVLGVIRLSDVVKPGMRERFAELRAMGIRTVMITGDNPRTARAIAAEAGVDDYLAEATPEDKMALIRQEQEGGRLVAMTGDGTNDAPALAQADVGVAMNTGTAAAKEAGNMVDLDSDPTKLIEIVEIGKQLLITRGALTTFSIANDLAKYFAILPAMFVVLYPPLGALNVMGLATPQSAILSAVIFNALIIVALIPLALRGVRYRPDQCGEPVAPQPVDLRPRRRGLALRRDLPHRPARPTDPGDLMVTMLRRQAATGLRILLVFTVLVGIAYPLADVGGDPAAGPLRAAEGSVVYAQNGTPAGSSLIGIDPVADPAPTRSSTPAPRLPSSDVSDRPSPPAARTRAPSAAKLLDTINQRRQQIAAREGVPRRPCPPTR